MDILLTKLPTGALAPATEDDADKLRRFKAGATLKAAVTQPRNVRFFRKWWSLVKVAYDLWAETCPPVQYRGEPVLPDFETFRRNVTILAGFHKPVVNVRGELRLEAESIGFGSMTEERFDALYSATIDVVLHKILPGRGLTETQLREWSERVMEYA